MQVEQHAPDVAAQVDRESAAQAAALLDREIDADQAQQDPHGRRDAQDPVPRQAEEQIVVDLEQHAQKVGAIQTELTAVARAGDLPRVRIHIDDGGENGAARISPAPAPPAGRLARKNVHALSGPAPGVTVPMTASG